MDSDGDFAKPKASAPGQSLYDSAGNDTAKPKTPATGARLADDTVGAGAKSKAVKPTGDLKQQQPSAPPAQAPKEVKPPL